MQLLGGRHVEIDKNVALLDIDYEQLQELATWPSHMWLAGGRKIFTISFNINQPLREFAFGARSSDSNRARSA